MHFYYIGMDQHSYSVLYSWWEVLLQHYIMNVVNSFSLPLVMVFRMVFLQCILPTYSEVSPLLYSWFWYAQYALKLTTVCTLNMESSYYSIKSESFDWDNNWYRFILRDGTQRQPYQQLEVIYIDRPCGIILGGKYRRLLRITWETSIFIDI